MWQLAGWKADQGDLIWDQGVQERDDLPATFVAWVEKKAASGGITTPLEYITWFDTDPSLLICDFGLAGSLNLRIKGD